MTLFCGTLCPTITIIVIRPEIRSCSLPCCCQIWMASCYLALYGAYVTIVLKGPATGSKGGDTSNLSNQEGLEVGGIGSGMDEHAVHARWM